LIFNGHIQSRKHRVHRYSDFVSDGERQLEELPYYVIGLLQLCFGSIFRNAHLKTLRF